MLAFQRALYTFCMLYVTTFKFQTTIGLDMSDFQTVNMLNSTRICLVVSVFDICQNMDIYVPVLACAI